MAAKFAAAPNSLFASSRWHLCRGFNQPFVDCLVNATLRIKPDGQGLIGMRCNLATIAGRVFFLAAAFALAGCASGSDGLTYMSDRDGSTPVYPANYRADIQAFLRTYLNNPSGIREAAVAEPVTRETGGHTRYTVCVKFNARENDGTYKGAKERAALFVNGRFDRLVEKPEDLCKGVTYAPFPELEKLTR